MMAVDSKTNTANGTPASTVTAKGTGALPSLGRRKRSSSLMSAASALPNVEHSLEEFIAKANQTLVDVSTWDAANEAAKQEDASRKEQDALRWRAAEQQMRESAARESSLRRQLDGLQGKLAEAEARAAVAGTQMGSAAHDTTISDLKAQIDKAMQRMRAAEERSAELAQELQVTKSGAVMRPSDSSISGPVDADAAERIRLAEAKAAKALAAARAAQAGLTVSPADLAAIESGLVMPAPSAKKTPWLPILGAFAGGIVIMFAVWKLALDKSDTKSAAPAAVAAPVITAPIVEPIETKPSVTPIEPVAAKVEPAPVAAKEEPAVAKEEPAVAKEEPAVAKEEPAVAKEEPAPVKAEPVKAAAKVVEKKAAPKAAPKKAAAKKSTSSDLADPFAEPAPAKKPKAEKPAAGGIVDPF